ncbi:Indian Hedgehog Protein [Manis pentadactyla]|nr:Indian Hedgehog Protein [Manis pentadactyla]
MHPGVPFGSLEMLQRWGPGESRAGQQMGEQSGVEQAGSGWSPDPHPQLAVARARLALPSCQLQQGQVHVAGGDVLDALRDEGSRCRQGMTEDCEDTFNSLEINAYVRGMGEMLRGAYGWRLGGRAGGAGLELEHTGAFDAGASPEDTQGVFGHKPTSQKGAESEYQ